MYLPHYNTTIVMRTIELSLQSGRNSDSGLLAREAVFDGIGE